MKTTVNTEQFSSNQQAINAVPITAADTPGGAPASAPDYEGSATHLGDLLDQIIAAMPDLEKRDAVQQKAQTVNRGVPAIFVSEAIPAAGAISELGAAIDLSTTPNDLRYVTVFS